MTVDMLLETTKKTMKRLPGFLSANIHKSADGVRVVNYAQWLSREDLRRCLKILTHRAHETNFGDCKVRR